VGRSGNRGLLFQSENHGEVIREHSQRSRRARARLNHKIAELAISFLEHASEHCGQFAIYARWRGIVSPASRSDRRHNREMVPAIILLVSFAALRLAGLLGVTLLDNWNLPLRAALFLMFLVTASAHWGRGRPDLIRMVPAAFPAPGVLVTVTGLLEILGAIGLLIPATWRIAACCLAMLLMALFPANMRAAREGLTILGRKAMSVPARGALQLLFIGALAAVLQTSA
jgi:uncharacterized membrane protein